MNNRREAPDQIPSRWLREALLVCGVSQAELARRLHVDKTTLNRWATGGLSRHLWYACLIGLDLPRTWQPRENA